MGQIYQCLFSIKSKEVDKIREEIPWTKPTVPLIIFDLNGLIAIRHWRSPVDSFYRHKNLGRKNLSMLLSST